MNRLLRTFVMLPAMILGFVIIPALVFSLGFGADGFSWDAQAAELYSPSGQGTISPLPTPPGTVPYPTPTRRPHHHHPYPTVTPTVMPTPTTTPESPDAAYANGERLEKVIGDRLSPVIYGYTTDGALYRSPDNGATWVLVITTPAVDDFVMSAADPNTLYSGKGAPCDGVSTVTEPMFKSIDGGLTWTELPDSTNKRPLLAHQGDVDSIFAADCEMPYVSKDGGQTWTAKAGNPAEALWDTYVVIDMVAASLLGDPQPTTPNWEQIYAGGVAADGSGVVAFTNDEGNTWVRLTPNVFPSSWGLSSLTADVYIEGLIGFAEPKGVWTTENYGADWQFSAEGLRNVIDRGIPGSYGLNDLAYHPNDQFYLATVRGLYTKALADTDWEKVTETAYDLISVNSILYTESNLGKLWLNTADGVYIYTIQ